MVNDPIADLLTRVRNATMRSRKEIVVPWSNMLEAIVKILAEENFVESYEVTTGENAIKEIKMELSYDTTGNSVIHTIERISKPGLRIYKGYREIPKVLNGLGVSIFSTPKGVMTGKQAKTAKVGGEYLCNIW